MDEFIHIYILMLYTMPHHQYLFIAIFMFLDDGLYNLHNPREIRYRFQANKMMVQGPRRANACGDHNEGVERRPWLTLSFAFLCVTDVRPLIFDVPIRITICIWIQHPIPIVFRTSVVLVARVVLVRPIREPRTEAVRNGFLQLCCGVTGSACVGASAFNAPVRSLGRLGLFLSLGGLPGLLLLHSF